MNKAVAPKGARSGGSFGFTLIELMLGIVVLAVLLALTIPSFTSQFEKQRLKGAGERLVSVMQFARSEAVGTNQNISVNVQGGAGWCVGVGVANTCDCAAGTDCQIDGMDRIIGASAFDGVVMAEATETIEFDGVRGLPVDPALQEFFFDGENGNRVGVRVNQLGRVSICSPAGEQKVGEYPEC